MPLTSASAEVSGRGQYNPVGQDGGGTVAAGRLGDHLCLHQSIEHGCRHNTLVQQAIVIRLHHGLLNAAYLIGLESIVVRIACVYHQLE